MAVNLQVEDAVAVVANQEIFLRTIIGGPPGAGKTWTALLLASEFAKRTNSFVGVIESERGRSTHYADTFPHKIVRLPDFSIETYIQAMGVLFKMGCRALVIDSLTHAWEGGVKDDVQAAKKKMGNNEWSAWSVGKAQQRKLVDAIMRYPGFVVATSRMKIETEYVSGRVQKKGMRFEQEAGIEYEFDISCEMTTPDHSLTVIKSVLGDYLPVGKTIMVPDAQLAGDIFSWLDRQTAPLASPSTQPLQTAPQTAQMSHLDRVMAGGHLPPVTTPPVTSNPAQRKRELAEESASRRATDPTREGDAGPDIGFTVNGPDDNGITGPDHDEPPPPPARPAPQPTTPPTRPPTASPTANPRNPQVASGKLLKAPAKPANDDETLASGQQITAIKKLAADRGYATEPFPNITRAQAGIMIATLSREPRVNNPRVAAPPDHRPSAPVNTRMYGPPAREDVEAGSDDDASGEANYAPFNEEHPFGDDE